MRDLQFCAFFVIIEAEMMQRPTALASVSLKLSMFFTAIATMFINVIWFITNGIMWYVNFVNYIVIKYEEIVISNKINVLILFLKKIFTNWN